MTLDLDDTIVAIASAPGGGLRGIVRISGPAAATIAGKLFTPEAGHNVTAAKLATCQRGDFALPRALGRVPATLYLWPTKNSYTRQPSAEVHLPGSPPLLEASLEVICQAGARLARPGEFTLRAFLAGRLDLTQAEAVLGVIDAHSRQELDAALSQLAGGLARPLQALRGQLLDLLAELEAGLDFVDEDIEFVTREELTRQLAAAEAAIEALAKQMQSRGEAGTLPRVVLVGLPNAGKSSLLNALAGEEAAIVSEVAGTTRDVVTRRAKLAGWDCLLADTAGVEVERASHGVAAAAQAMTREQTAQADLVLWCVDANQRLSDVQRAEIGESLPTQRLLVCTKCDLPYGEVAVDGAEVIYTSSRTGAGIAELKAKIAATLAARLGEADAVIGTAERCRDSLRRAGESIQLAQATTDEELIAAEIRVALDELGLVAGVTYTDDILDRIFSRFCIGK